MWNVNFVNWCKRELIIEDFFLVGIGIKICEMKFFLIIMIVIIISIVLFVRNIEW